MSLNYDSSNYVCGGYFITKFVDKPPYLASQPLPNPLISASPCLAEIIPDSWTFNWIPQAASSFRQEKASKFGIEIEKVLPLCERITELESQKKLGYSRVIFELNTARQLRQEFIPAFGTNRATET